MGRWLIIAGFALVVLGSVLLFAPWLLNWFGRLPGDIRIESANGKIFIPITSMLIISVLLSLALSLLRR